MHAQDGRSPARRRRRTVAIAVGAMVALGVISTPAWATIVPEYDADEVAKAIIHDEATLDVANTDWQELATPVPSPTPLPEETPEPFPAAVSVAPLGGFPTSPASFAVLATGDVASLDQPNDDEGTSWVFDLADPSVEPLPHSDNGALHGNTDNDVTILKLGVTVPAGMNCASLDYRFLSEEFPEYVNQDFNDAFIAEIDNLTLDHDRQRHRSHGRLRDGAERCARQRRRRRRRRGHGRGGGRNHVRRRDRSRDHEERDHCRAARDLPVGLRSGRFRLGLRGDARPARVHRRGPEYVQAA